MTNELTIRNQETALSPAEVVEFSTTQAKLLMDIVEKTRCFQEVSGKKYLQVEAWETIGAFNRTHSETESIAPITKGEDIIGYQAHVQLWKDGVIVGGAIMPCYFTENCCKGKEGDAKHKACISAAQTFATSKAYRMNFGYVAILAGYQPLPAEEITDDMKVVDETQYWCTEHNVAFFMKGKMKSYAHPIEGTEPVEWCHKHKTEPKPEPKPKPAPEPEPIENIFPEEKTGPAPKTEAEEAKGFIDLDWFEESILILQAKKLKAWTESNLLSYMKTTYKVEAATVLGAAVLLDKGQAAHFVKRIQDTLEMA